MPTKARIAAERRRKRLLALLSVLDNPTATPAEILKASAALDRMEREAAPKPEKPAEPPVDQSAAIELLRQLNAPPPPIVPPEPTAEKCLVDFSRPVEERIAEDAANRQIYETPADWEKAQSDPWDRHVSWNSVYGHAALTDDFKASTELWAEQVRADEDERQTLIRQIESKRAQAAGSTAAWKRGQTNE